MDNTFTLEHDVQYFKDQLNFEIGRLNGLCDKWGQIKLTLPDSMDREIIDHFDVAIGQTKLLLGSKFVQFQNLIKFCETGDETSPSVRCRDLDGFWDLLLLEVVSLDRKFQTLDKLKDDDFIETSPVVDPTKTVKKSSKMQITGLKKPSRSNLPRTNVPEEVLKVKHNTPMIMKLVLIQRRFSDLCVKDAPSDVKTSETKTTPPQNLDPAKSNALSKSGEQVPHVDDIRTSPRRSRRLAKKTNAIEAMRSGLKLNTISESAESSSMATVLKPQPVENNTSPSTAPAPAKALKEPRKKTGRKNPAKSKENDDVEERLGGKTVKGVPRILKMKTSPKKKGGKSSPDDSKDQIPNSLASLPEPTVRRPVNRTKKNKE